MPGQTCPVFDTGDEVAAGASCYAVVRFSPTEGFLGWQAEGSLIATATAVGHHGRRALHPGPGHGGALTRLAPGQSVGVGPS